MPLIKNCNSLFTSLRKTNRFGNPIIFPLHFQVQQIDVKKIFDVHRISEDFASFLLNLILINVFNEWRIRSARQRKGDQPGPRRLSVILLARVESRDRRDLFYRQRRLGGAAGPTHRYVEDAGLTLRQPQKKISFAPRSTARYYLEILTHCEYGGNFFYPVDRPLRLAQGR